MILMHQLKSLISTPLARGDQRGDDSHHYPVAYDGQMTRDKQCGKASSFSATRSDVAKDERCSESGVVDE